MSDKTKVWKALTKEYYLSSIIDRLVLRRLNKNIPIQPLIYALMIIYPLLMLVSSTVSKLKRIRQTL